MRKNYVLDTNVLIYDPKSLFQFEDNLIWIPVYVLEEIDKFKSEASQRGHSARDVSRILDDLRCHGSLSDGVDLPGGGKLTVAVPEKHRTLAVAVNDNFDHAILQTALTIKESNCELKTILVTMDINLRVRAEALGVQTATYENNRVDLSNLTNNVLEIKTDLINKFYKDGFLKQEELDRDLLENQCVHLKNGSQSGLGRVIKGDVCKLSTDGKCNGVKARNLEQHFALDLLLDDEVQLVSLMGRAGTGKTLLALAAGMKGLSDGNYQKLLVSRPVIPMGKDIGFLPGGIKEKMDPWMKPIWDNLDFLMHAGGKGVRQVEELIEVEPLTYIRGRSIPWQYIIIDEAQNLSPHEIKTIVTRCGEGTKLVLTGDPYQIDSPYMDVGTNGLSVIVKKMIDHPLVGHLHLTKGERSPLATLAAETL